MYRREFARHTKNYFDDCGINYRLILFIVFFRIISDWDIMVSLNIWLQAKWGFQLSSDLEGIFATFHSINSPLDQEKIFPIFAALYLPPLINAYAAASTVNSVWKIYIAKAFKPGIVLNLIAIVLISQKSKSAPYLIFTFLVLTWNLFGLYIQFRDFLLFRKSSKLTKVLRGIIGENSSVRKNFLSTVHSADGLVNELVEKREIGPIEGGGTFLTNEARRPKNVHAVRFKSWLDSIASALEPKQTEVATDFGSEPTPALVEDEYLNLFNVTILYDDRRLGIGASIDVHPDFKFSDLKSDSLLKADFLACFECEDASTSIEEEEQVKDFISGLDVHLLSLLEQKRFDVFKAEIDLLSTVVEDFKEDQSATSELLILSYKVMNLFDSSGMLKQSTPCKLIVYEFWLKLFRAFSVSGNAKYLKDVFRSLMAGVRNGVFDGSDYTRMERDLYQAIRYSKYKQPLSEEFVIEYVRALVGLAQTLAKLGKSDESLRFILMVHNLQEDVKRGFLFPDEPELKKAALSFSRKGCMIFAAYMLDKGNVELFKRSIQYIDLTEFLETLEQAYWNEDKVWNHIWWDESEYDRHGLGQVKSFCISTFYETFLFEFLRDNPRNSIATEHVLDFRLKYLFEKVKTLLKAERPMKEKALAFVETVITKSRECEEDAIINAELKQSRIDILFKECAERYFNAKRFSAKFKSEIVRTEKEGGLGFNISMPKQDFIEDFNVILSGLFEMGKGLAEGENKKLFNALKSKYGFIKSSPDEFFKIRLPRYIRSGSFELMTNHYDRGELSFGWDGACKLNPDLKKVEADGAERIESTVGEGIAFSRFSIGRDRRDRRYYVLLRKQAGAKVTFEVPEQAFDSSQQVFYRVDHWARNDAIRNELAQSDRYFKDLDIPQASRDRYLKTKVGFQLYVNPRIEFVSPVDGVEQADAVIFDLGKDED